MIGDIIGEVEVVVMVWVDVCYKEISQLWEQEVFCWEFFGNLVYELKMFVFFIQGYVFILFDGVFEDENVNWMFFERVFKVVDCMVYILNDLDELMKLEVNDFKLELCLFDVRELVWEVMELLELCVREVEIRVKFFKEVS